MRDPVIRLDPKDNIVVRASDADALENLIKHQSWR